MKNEDNTQKEQTEGAWEAMSRIIIQQESKTQLDTIRARVIEQSIWRQGRRIVHGTWTKGSKNVGIARSAQKCTKMCEESGIELLRLGSNISAWIMSAKMK